LEELQSVKLEGNNQGVASAANIGPLGVRINGGFDVGVVAYDFWSGAARVWEYRRRNEPRNQRCTPSNEPLCGIATMIVAAREMAMKEDTGRL
jgi:hypothetical protein